MAVVYHYFAHYREPVIRELVEQTGSAPRYVLVSDSTSNLPALQCIDREALEASLPEGALDWRPVRNRWFRDTLLWQQGLVRMSASRDYDAIIFLGNVYFLSTWIAAIVARWTGKQVLMWTHGQRARETGMKGALRGAFYRLADDLLLYGERGAQLLQSQGIPSERLHVVYNSLDYRRQVQIRRRFDEASRERLVRQLFGGRSPSVLVYIGRVTAEKRLELLLQAVLTLSKDRERDVVALIVGDGPGRAALEAEADRMGLSDRVRFHGASYDEEETGALLDCGSVCVVPGDLGLSGIHALTYGTPVVTHDELDRQKPEVEAVVAGETGSFYRSGDVESLVDEIDRWLEARADPDALRRQCMAVVDSKYNPGVQVERINAAIRPVGTAA